MHRCLYQFKKFTHLFLFVIQNLCNLTPLRHYLRVRHNCSFHINRAPLPFNADHVFEVIGANDLDAYIDVLCELTNFTVNLRAARLRRFQIDF